MYLKEVGNSSIVDELMTDILMPTANKKVYRYTETMGISINIIKTAQVEPANMVVTMITSFPARLIITDITDQPIRCSIMTVVTLTKVLGSNLVRHVIFSVEFELIW